VISRWARIEKFLNYLLIFLLPTQLALHFWPPSAFVFGLRVDYLAPAIYLTDILFLAVLVPWVCKNHKKFSSDLKKHKLYIFVFIVFVVANTAFSISIFPSVFKWLKVVELVMFYYYVSVRNDIFKDRKVLPVIFYSLLFFSLIGIIQFLLGKTLGGPLYILGERNFNISTPGIALAQLVGINFMRAYSTFSHPNSFAGFLGVGILFLVFNYSWKDSSRKIFGLLIIFLAFVLTFSTAAFLGMLACLVVFWIWRKKIFNSKNVVFLTGVFLMISLIQPFFASVILKNNFNLTQNISQRFELALGAGRVISQKFFLGEGLNTFIVGESKITQLGFYLWILQPVHNFFLLIFSETGIFGLLIVFWIITGMFRKTLATKNIAIFMCLVFVLTTGLFDHYWFTLQQNTLLFAFILGDSIRGRS